MRFIHVTNKVPPAGTMCLHLSVKEKFCQNFTACVKEESQSGPAMAYENTSSLFN